MEGVQGEGLNVPNQEIKVGLTVTESVPSTQIPNEGSLLESKAGSHPNLDPLSQREKEKEEFLLTGKGDIQETLPTPHSEKCKTIFNVVPSLKPAEFLEAEEEASKKDRALSLPNPPSSHLNEKPASDNDRRAAVALKKVSWNTTVKMDSDGDAASSGGDEGLNKGVTKVADAEGLIAPKDGKSQPLRENLTKIQATDAKGLITSNAARAEGVAHEESPKVVMGVAKKTAWDALMSTAATKSASFSEGYGAAPFLKGANMERLRVGLRRCASGKESAHRPRRPLGLAVRVTSPVEHVISILQRILHEADLSEQQREDIKYTLATITSCRLYTSELALTSDGGSNAPSRMASMNSRSSSSLSRNASMNMRSSAAPSRSASITSRTFRTHSHATSFNPRTSPPSASTTGEGEQSEDLEVDVEIEEMELQEREAESLGMDAETETWLANEFQLGISNKPAQESKDVEAQRVLPVMGQDALDTSSPANCNGNGNDTSLSPHLSTPKVAEIDERVIKALEGRHSFHFNVFELAEVDGGGALRNLALALFDDHGLPTKLGISKSTLDNLLTCLQQGYNQVPYHSSVHAADVLFSANYFLTQGGLCKWMSDIEILAFLLAAVIHDFRHPGLSNLFLVNSGDPLAVMYNDTAVLENHHCAQAFLVLNQPENNILLPLPPDQRKEVRRLILKLVLITDMSVHFEFAGRFRSLVLCETANLDAPDLRICILQMALKCADINSATKPLQLARKWAELVMEEFFLQGDKEKALGLPVSPMCDRCGADVPTAQLRFIDYIVQPLYSMWAEYIPIADQFLHQLHINRNFWESGGEPQLEQE